MARLSLYMIGIGAGIAAIFTYVSRARSTKSNGRVPAQEAAEQLREAWSDHHTVA